MTVIQDAPPGLSPADEQTAARALAARHRLEFVDVASFAPDPELLQSVPVELMFRYTFLPYRREAGHLVLVMADPTDIPVLDELALLLRTPILPAVGAPTAIQEALKRGQGTQRVLEEASESFKIQVIHDDDNGDEVLSIDKIQADQSPIIRLVDSAIFDALNRRASDIHIETRDQEVMIKYRIDGVLQPAMKPIAKEHHGTIISRIKVMAELDIAEKRVPQDGRFRVRIRDDPSTSASPSCRPSTERTLSSASSTRRACRSSSRPCDSTSLASTRRSSPASGASSRSPMGWSWSPVPRARGRPRPSTRPSRRSGRRRTRSSRSRIPWSISSAGSPRFPSTRRRASPSPGVCAPSCATTPTRSWWERSATLKRPTSRSNRPSPATSSSPPSTPTTS